MAINRHIQHIKSQVVENGAPKLPTSSQIQLGEIAINYAKDHETIAIKNASGEIVTFSSDVARDGEHRVIAASLNDLNERKVDTSTLNSTLNDYCKISDAENLIETTYSNLKALRDGGNLKKGTWYRITDYVTTTVQSETQSAGHQFDIIVRADSPNTLNENAYAALHSGDTYFANSKLNAWELKYCLTNDTTFNWADSTNGKGVIYYMKDEWGNECGYDFKNIRFKRYSPIDYSQQALKGLDGTVYPKGISITTATTSVWCYTFNTARGDASILNFDEAAICHNNVIPLYYDGDDVIFYLNNIVINTMTLSDSKCYNNRFGFKCCDSTLKNNAISNNIGDGFKGNVISTYFRYNIIGNNFYNNTIAGTYFQYNNVGNSFQDNNVSGNYVSYNTFGNIVTDNSFTGRLSYSSIGNSCRYLNINKGYVYNLNIEDGNQYITLTSTQTTSTSNKLQNIRIARGVNNSTTLKTISHDTVNDAFDTTYQSSNSQTINI